MANNDDDDLDAFFSEVSAVEAQAKQEEAEKKDDEQEEPPAKKAKVQHKPPRRPVGVVVAAAASSQAKSVVQEQPETTNTEYNNTNHHPIPVPGSQGPPEQPPTTAQTPETTITQQQQQQQSTQKSYTKRSAAGKVWVDATLDEWPAHDYRLFVGNLAKDVTNQSLHDHFAAKYPSVAMAKVVRDGEGNSRGFGFVSLLEPMECARAMREMDQTWLSSRPIRVKRSDWKDRDFKQVVKKNKKNNRAKRKKGFQL